jgi:hypothetical protein
MSGRLSRAVMNRAAARRVAAWEAARSKPATMPPPAAVNPVDVPLSRDGELLVAMIAEYNRTATGRPVSP